MRRPTFLLLAFAALAAAACSRSLEPPPVEISFRESLLGAGKIVRVTNTGNEPLTRVEVTIRAADGDERSFVQESIDGFATLELGWKKLGGWEVPPGADVEVRAEGFLRAAAGTIPDESTPPGE